MMAEGARAPGAGSWIIFHRFIKILNYWFVYQFRPIYVLGLLIMHLQLNNWMTDYSLSDKTLQSKLQASVKAAVLYVLQELLGVLLFVAKAIMIPIVYPFCWGIAIVMWISNACKLLLTFLMNGIIGVLLAMKALPFGEGLHYAILKENGMYLKLSRYSIEDAFICQLYDYSIRKFMTTLKVEEDLRIGEIQPWSQTGLRYLKRELKLKKITVFENSSEKLERLRNKLSNIDFVLTDYSQEAEERPQDIFIMFNRSKDSDIYQNYVGIIKMLGYMRRNLQENGYLVLGNCFASEGEVTVFEELIEGLGFRISMKENVTRNIIHAHKILSKTYHDRKVAWAKDKCKSLFSYLITGEHTLGKFLKSAWEKMETITGVNYRASQYIIYILQPHI